LLGVKVVFILSFARVNSRAKSADLIYKIADKFIIQWPDAKHNYSKGIYLGGIY
jgi:beta-1,4-N-acetylglucosaminyltransferase